MLNYTELEFNYLLKGKKIEQKENKQTENKQTENKQTVQNSPQTTDYLSIALKAFSLNKSNIKDVDIDDEGTTVEVSFKKDNIEYDVTIDKATNAILHKHSEIDD